MTDEDFQIALMLRQLDADEARDSLEALTQDLRHNLEENARKDYGAAWVARHPEEIEAEVKRHMPELRRQAAVLKAAKDEIRKELIELKIRRMEQNLEILEELLDDREECERLEELLEEEEDL